MLTVNIKRVGNCRLRKTFVILLLFTFRNFVCGYSESVKNMAEGDYNWHTRQLDSLTSIFPNIISMFNSGGAAINSLTPMLDSGGAVMKTLIPIFGSGNYPIKSIISMLDSGGAAMKNLIPMLLQQFNISLVPTVAMVSNQCRFDIELSVDNFNGDEKGLGTTQNWGFQMNEAFGKMPGGITQGNLYWMGDFQQCTSIHVWRNASTMHEPPDFLGKYCLIAIGIPAIPLPSLKVGTCFPSSCNFQDIQLLINSQLTIPLQAMINESFCQTLDDSKWDKTSKSIGIFILCLIIFVFLATCAELTVEFLSKAKKEMLPSQTDTSKNGCSCSIKSFLLSFSVIQNTSRLFQTPSTTGCSVSALASLHGLRAISISWVILGHAFMLIHQDYPWKNQVHALSFLKDFLFQAIFGGEYAVDTFLCMSGFLVAYIFLDEMRKRDGHINIFVYYLHRLWRLLPAYALIIAYMSGPFVALGSGPIWPAVQGDTTHCRERWWQNLLFINIYYDLKDQCLPQAWYLCLDLTYYCLAPFILYPLFKKPRLGHIIFLVFFVTSYVVPAWIIHQEKLASYPAWNAEQWQRDKFMNKVYNKPWCRMSAYLIGMIYGYLFYLKGSKMVMKPLVVITGWSVSIATCLAIIYSTYPVLKGDEEMHHVEFVFYGSFVRPSWAASIGWVMLACATGHGGYINSVLSWSGFHPFSRLSYTAYLVHFTVAAHFFASRRDSIYIDYYTMAYFCIGLFFVTMFFAMILTLMAESPFMALEKLLLPAEERSPMQQSPIRHREKAEIGNLLPPTSNNRRRPPPITKQNRVDDHQDLHYHPLVSATSDTETVYHDVEDDSLSLRSDFESSAEDTIYRKPYPVGSQTQTRAIY